MLDVDWTALDPKSPFYTLNKISVLNCQRIYELIISEQSFKNGLIPRHSEPCGQDKLLPAYEIVKAIPSQLNERNYDISSLEWLTELTSDIEGFLSKSNASLRGEFLYLPAIEYQQGVYAAVLRREDSGNFRLEYFQIQVKFHFLIWRQKHHC